MPTLPSFSRLIAFPRSTALSSLVGFDCPESNRVRSWRGRSNPRRLYIVITSTPSSLLLEPASIPVALVHTLDGGVDFTLRCAYGCQQVCDCLHGVHTLIDEVLAERPAYRRRGISHVVALLPCAEDFCCLLEWFERLSLAVIYLIENTCVQ